MVNKHKWNPPNWCAVCLTPITQQLLSTNSCTNYCPDCTNRILSFGFSGITQRQEISTGGF